jgi:hypothetical protein
MQPSMGKRSHDGEQEQSKSKSSSEVRPLPRKLARIKPAASSLEYTIRYRKQDRGLDSYKVRLSVPAPEEECPLTLDAMASSALEFLPDIPFMERHPDFKKMTLPCGHSFAAMPLFYHMCRNNLLCPCCRQGVEGNVCSESIPVHFRQEIMERVQTLTAQQQLEEEQSALAQIMEMESYLGNFEDIANQGNLSMVLEFTSLPPTRAGSFVFHILLMPVQMDSQEGRQGAVFRPVPTQQRLLTHLRGLSDLVEISIQMRIPQLGITQLETTGRMSIRGQEGVRSIRGQSSGMWTGLAAAQDWVSISTFDIVFERQEGETFISSLGWRPDSHQVRWMATQP